PAENLACDEALLDFSEENGGPEILRLWEPAQYFVVVGYANKVELEVNIENCSAKQIPILRRCSGGGAVVQGPGCLNYSLVLNFTENHLLQTITQTNGFVMERHREALQTHWGTAAIIKGHTDLAVGLLKFSGNAQRRRKNFLLFHGTFLLDFKIREIEELLKMPSKQPTYREGRSHEKFLMNLRRPPEELKLLLREVWDAADQLEFVPHFAKLLGEKYSRNDWNFKF
ncbi:MAG: lipoate--protein ligase family protein, partial [Verrucomicrobiota bacterium]